jgi:hypothetical protein
MVPLKRKSPDESGRSSLLGKCTGSAMGLSRERLVDRPAEEAIKGEDQRFVSQDRVKRVFSIACRETEAGGKRKQDAGNRPRPYGGLKVKPSPGRGRTRHRLSVVGICEADSDYPENQ